MIEKALQGDSLALGRLARLVDDSDAGAARIIADLFPMGGRAHIVGITGPPGAGKSTLISALVREERSRERRVGVLAVDPTSPFSGGAVLGDRIRMQEHATDPGVFIRSLASRGHMGGLSRSVLPLITLLDAAGFDTIILETVGVGQEDVEVKDLAHTTIFVTVPGLGDGIQAMKAGVLEIAHIYLVNKADLPHSESAARDLRSLINHAMNESDWEPPVLMAVASQGTGVSELAEKINGHWLYLNESDGLAEWSIASAEVSIRQAVHGEVEARAMEAFRNDDEALREDIRRVALREEDPMTVARRWLDRLSSMEAWK